jgi:predicted small metal-binding protein
MKTALRCPCGLLIEAEDEDALVARVLAHLRAEHPERADEYTREQILLLAF